MQNVTTTYAKNSSMGRLSGINSQGQAQEVVDEIDFQVMYAMQKIARDVEYTLLQGAYQIATSAAVANKTRGIGECASDASNTVAAGSVALTKALIDELLRTMADNGAPFRDPAIYVNSFQKQKISDIYGYAPESKTEGGVAVTKILTDFGEMEVIFDRFASTSVLTVVDRAVCDLVFQPVPGKGVLFLEELSKSGAADNYMLYSQIGLDHGPKWAHGTITGLATS
jgi:hypothetical protein